MRQTNRTPGEALTRRTLARALAGAAAAVCLPSAAETPPAGGVSDATLDAAVASAFAATPATLSPQQRLDVRSGVRSLQQALTEARRAPLTYEAQPATVFLAKPVPE